MKWIDAPVSGGPNAARQGTLTVMAGGDAGSIAAVAAVMSDLAANFTHAGPSGAGQAAKVINQAIVGTTYVLMAEALMLAEAAGIDAAKLPQCLAGGHADGNLLQQLYPRMQARAFEPPLAYARQLLKDMLAVQVGGPQLRTRPAADRAGGRTASRLCRRRQRNDRSRFDRASLREQTNHQPDRESAMNITRTTSIGITALFAAILFVATGATSRADGLDDIKAAKKLRVAIDLGLPPYGMTDDKMQPTGSDVETGKLLAKDLGVEFELVPTTGASRIPSLQSGKADVVISTLSVTPERAKVIDFSPGYAVLRTVVAGVKGINVKSLADLDGKTIATTRGTTHDTYLTQNAKNSKIVRYEDDATEAQAFVSGQVDLFSTAELLMAPIAARNPSRQLELKFVIDTFNLAIGVKQGEPRLLQTVSDWVKTNLKNGKLNEIYKKVPWQRSARLRSQGWHLSRSSKKTKNIGEVS